MCMFVFLVCSHCEEPTFSASDSFICGSRLCGRYEYYNWGFPMQMCLGINGKCGTCPSGKYCANVYKRETCINHLPQTISSSLNEELSDLFKSLELN